MRAKLNFLAAATLLTAATIGLGQPAITNQPQTQAVAPGTTATFTVVAGGAQPLAYQWQRNLGTGFSDLAGSTSSILALTNVQTWDATDYRVVVTNLTGARTSAVAHLYIMRFAPASTTVFTDNFDDNINRDWTLLLNAGTGALRETNGQFTVSGSWPGVPTVHPWETYAMALIYRNWSLADGQTFEFRADLVALSENATNAAQIELPQDGDHTYILAKGRDFVRIAKFSLSGSSTLWYERALIRNSNVVLSLALTRANPNVILTARVLDKKNPSAVLYQHSVVDTPAADPTFNLPDMSFITVPDVPGAPYTWGPGVLLALWQYTDGHQPAAQVTYDNFEIRKYDPFFTRYVDLDSTNATPPYTNWATAALTVQDAVDAASAGDEIVVTNGVYAAGGRAVYGTMTNRVAVDKLLTLRSVNGPEFTVIQGHQVPGTTNGEGAIRCVYLTNGASLSGFTLTNGGTRTEGDWAQEQSGGAVLCESTNALVSNCIVIGNSAFQGGGVAGGTLNHCALTGNTAVGGGGAARAILNDCALTANAASNGGGAAGGPWGGGVCALNRCVLARNSAQNAGGGAGDSTLNNCTLTGNESQSRGGGAAGGWLNNCTVTGNRAAYGGGISDGCFGSSTTLKNCIVDLNSAPDAPNYWDYWVSLDYCCTTPMPTNGVGNITNAPLFVDYDGGNLRLQSNSPCINAGSNAYAPGSTDVDGNPRIVSGTVDIGAYEFQGSGSVISYAWLQQYGLPTDGSADFADSDHDGLSNWQEWRCATSPTNALSALRLLAVSPTGTNLSVSWQSVAGVSYFLERSTNLAASPPFSLLATNLPGQSGTTSFTVTNAAILGPLFYRVGVGN